ncbi:MAG: toprim domain-containing protein, partial [Verrucomicrobia bacterium]|nr:toprim domain-containing protein [Verrucomicrobiota bacterium]
ENVVAPQGTALTEKHAALLRRFAQEVLLFFDADRAGEKATERALEILYAAGLQVRIGRLPPNEDPDSLVRSQGAAAFQRLVEQSTDFFDFEIERASAQSANPTTAERVASARKLARFVSLVPDQVTRETMVSRLASRFNLPRAALEEMSRMPRPAARTPTSPSNPPPAALRHDLAVLANIVLTDRANREWLRAQSWGFILGNLPEAAFLRNILAADFDPENAASLATFLATLDPAEAALASQVLALKPIDPKVRKVFWLEFAAKQLRERRLQLERIRRLSPENSPASLAAERELKEILDHESDVKDISRLLTRAL